ncbi:MAG: YIP1 family protein [Candidatus Eremiobacteraeota bacterium]|nr:YIP1 family protein [Candidatus Eremiobacteraeota bacterium]
MVQETAVAPKSNGLATLRDVIVAPKAAFAELRVRPTWFWAFVITSVLGMIGGIMLIPASEHMATAMFATMSKTDPRFAQLTPAQMEQQISIMKIVTHYQFLMYPIGVLVAALATAVLGLIGNAIGGGDGNFRRYWALAMNVAIVMFGISYLLLGVIAMARGPESFSAPHDLFGAIPSIGWLVPGNYALSAFLSITSLFGIWSLVLVGLGFRITGGMKAPIAWTMSVVALLSSGLYAVAASQGK